MFEYYILVMKSVSSDIPWNIVCLHRRLLRERIRCHRKHSGQLNQSNIRALHGGKVWCHLVEYTAVFLYSDWLYFFSIFDDVINNYSTSARWIYKQWPPFGAKICSDICPRTLPVPRSEQFSKSRARETVSFEEQMMSEDKYPSIFFPKMKDIVFIIL